MKPLIEKLPPGKDNSFVARTYRTPHFEVPWHQHVEYELILFCEGEGRSFIGNYVGEFKPGDIFFLGSNLPHTFQKARKDLVTSAVVVQFREDFWGAGFLELPECKSIRKLFGVSMKGLKMRGETKKRLDALMRDLEQATGLHRIIGLCECLQLIAGRKEYDTVSTQEVTTFLSKNQERIDRIFRYTIEHFQEPITLDTVASHAGMSVPAFCNYFRKSTKKTYIDFLNGIRIGYACQQLMDTQKAIQEICFESGFNTLANFNKQFLKAKQATPSAFRKNFAGSGYENEAYLERQDASTEDRVLSAV